MTKAQVNDIFESYIYMVDHVFRKDFAYYWLIEEDLKQEGLFQLWKSCQNYEVEKEAGFKSYIYISIQGAMKKYLRDKHSTIRIPRKEYHLKARAGYLYSQGLSFVEICEQLNVSQAELKIIEACSDLVYLQTETPPMGDGRRNTDYYDTLDNGELSPHMIYELKHFHAHLKEAVKPCSKYADRVLEGLLEKKTQTEIGAELGISQMTVCRITKQMRSIIRDLLHNHYTISEWGQLT